MNPIVFAEGRNDVEFLSVLHKLYQNDQDYDVFRNENSQISETKRITQHIVGDSFSYLYKSEGGDGNLIEIFVEVSILAVDKTFDPYVLIDLDGAQPSDRLEEFNSTYTREFENDATLTCQSKTWWSDIVYMDCLLECDNASDTEVDVFAFYESLESHSNVRYRDDKPDRIATLKQYVEDNQEMFDCLSNILFK